MKRLPGSGDRDLESVAAAVDVRFRARLCRLVEREMDRRILRREDPEDVVQSAFRTFYQCVEQSHVEWDNSAVLWRLLQKIARRKILKHVEYHTAGRRDLRQETRGESLDVACDVDQIPHAHLLGDVLNAALHGLDPLDSYVAHLTLYGHSLTEIAETVLANLDAPYPEILLLRLEGNSERQIAESLHCGREAVRYRLRRMSERLCRLFSESQ